jgi:5-(carboxyamino)imidazole ribonucleotide synthase
MADLPLTQPRLHSPAIMLNLLGDLWFDKLGSDKLGSEPNSLKPNPLQVEPAWQQVLALPGTHLHLYGKREARVGRKMGHLNVTAATPEAARKVALQAATILGIAAF